MLTGDVAGQQHAAAIDRGGDAALGQQLRLHQPPLDVALDREVIDRAVNAAFLPGGVAAARGRPKAPNDKRSDATTKGQ